MDNMNFFFGLKAMKIPEMKENPESGSAIDGKDKQETTEKMALPEPGFPVEKDLILTSQERLQAID